MSTFVALLRGINVGGHNKVAMADLRRLCEDVGHRDVRTYVQSGNVVFATDHDDTAAVSAELTARMAADLGVAPTAIVRTIDELAAVVSANPFEEEARADPTKVHAAFLSTEPANPGVFDVDPESYAPERCAAGDRVRYLLLPDGIGRSRLATDLNRRPADVQITVRNWRTVTRLLAMARD